MGLFSGCVVGLLLGHSNFDTALVNFFHAVNKSWSPFPSSGQSPVSAISRCSEEGPQAQQVNPLPTSNQEKIQGNAELKYFILGVVGVGEKDR